MRRTVLLAPEGAAAAESHEEVLAPPLPAGVAEQVRQEFALDDAYGWACRISL